MSIRRKKNREKIENLAHKFSLVPQTETALMHEFSSSLAETFQDAESANQLFDTVCFFLVSLLGESVDDNFCHHMDACAPIGNIRYYMEFFDDQYTMAMQFQRDLSFRLNYWHSGSLRRYEFIKSQLISLRSVEFFLKFLQTQKEAFDSYLSDKMSQLETSKLSVFHVYLVRRSYSIEVLYIREEDQIRKNLSNGKRVAPLSRKLSRFD